MHPKGIHQNAHHAQIHLPPHSKAKTKKSKQTNEVIIITRWSTRTHSINNSTTRENKRHGHNRTTQVVGGEKHMYSSLCVNARNGSFQGFKTLVKRRNIARASSGERQGSSMGGDNHRVPFLSLGLGAAHHISSSHVRHVTCYHTNLQRPGT